MNSEIWFLGGFLAFFLLFLFLDLGIFRKKKYQDQISTKRYLLITVLVLILVIGFYFFLVKYGYLLHGINNFEDLEHIILKYGHSVELSSENFSIALSSYQKNLGLEYLTGYVVEYALSVDNIFVILMIFKSFSVDQRHHHKVLFWGILGAIILRFIFIFIGSGLMQKFGWIIYIFGLFLIYTGVKMFFYRNKKEKINTNGYFLIKFIKKYFEVHPEFSGDSFFVRIGRIRKVTPLFLVLILIELTDLIFAIDSIPAIFSVTKDPYIVFFSNIFAITGLRSLFFLLSKAVAKFRYLKTGLAFLLSFIGIKMVLHNYLEKWGFTSSHSLIVILFILFVSIFCSLLPVKNDTETI